MTKSEFYCIVDKIIEASPGTINGNELLGDLPGWDSLSVVAFISSFDKAFGAPPSAEALIACKSVTDLVALAGDRISD
jgi:acyl carrier protein